MQVVRQHHPGRNRKRPFGAGHADGVAQGFDLAGQRIGPARGQADGEEDRGAGAAGAVVAGHAREAGAAWLISGEKAAGGAVKERI
jgi:hypothetical protein